MVGRVGVHFIVRNACTLGGFFIQSGRRNGQVKYLQHRRTLRTTVAFVQAADVIRRNTPLLVGRARERYISRLPGNEIFDGNRIAHRKNIRIRGVHLIIYNNGASLIDAKSCITCQCTFRAHTNGQYHKVSCHLCARNFNSEVVFSFAHALQRCTQPQRYPFGRHMFFHFSCHFRVKRCNYLIAHLY